MRHSRQRRSVLRQSVLKQSVICQVMMGSALWLCAMSGHAAEAESWPFQECVGMESREQRLACYDQLAEQQRDVKAVTEALPESALKDRMRQELTAGVGDWTITPHRPTYFLPLSYVDYPNDLTLTDGMGNTDESVDNVEAKLQFSFKIPLWLNILGQSSSLYFGYTQLSFWQMYNSEISAPFRETNYEPELMLGIPLTRRFLGMDLNGLLFSFNHQSNGQTEPLSRSWNRIVANFLFSRGDLVINLRPWYRIPESDSNDDNPHIERYLGHGEIHVYYKDGDSVYGAMLRNNFRDENRGALQLDWSYQIHPKVKSYIQFFTGYGESLIDYDESVTRIGIGVMLTNWI